jgi:ubiquinone/menaquinone biosynthesis C-methylase UbiE
MSETADHDATTGVADNFTSTAKDYDAGVRHNIQGAARLIASLPPGDYRRVLDIGCGTGWASFAMLDRFACEHITGVDPAQGMLDVFQEKAAAMSGVEVDLKAEDVMAMSVATESYDAVISSMAMHWFPDKGGAAIKMAETLRPGGIIGILCSGRGGEHEFRAVLAGLSNPPAPPAWDAAFDAVQRDVDEMETYLVGAGLDPVDIWMERRLRRTTPEAYLERMRVVASHITAGELDEAQVAELMAQVEAGMHAAAGPRGFEYTFTKLYAVARKPG